MWQLVRPVKKSCVFCSSMKPTTVPSSSSATNRKSFAVPSSRWRSRSWRMPSMHSCRLRQGGSGKSTKRGTSPRMKSSSSSARRIRKLVSLMRRWFGGNDGAVLHRAGAAGKSRPRAIMAFAKVRAPPPRENTVNRFAPFRRVLRGPALLACAWLTLAATARAQETLRAINPSSLPPAHGYAHVVIAPPGRMVSISGQVAMDRSGKVVGADDFRAQCVQVFENLRIALHSAGLDFKDVVRTDMYVTDLGHLDVLRDVRAHYLPAGAPATSTLVK